MSATVLAWVALLSMTSAASLRAQESRPNLIGSRVRVTVAADSFAPLRVVVGNLVAVGDSALVIRPLETAVEEHLRTSRVQRFEVRTGKNRGAGAGLGALVGLLSGLAIGLALVDDCSNRSGICYDRSDTAAGGAVFGLGLGTAIGLIAGRGDQWEAAAVPSGVSVTPTSGGGVRLAASLRF